MTKKKNLWFMVRIIGIVTLFSIFLYGTLWAAEQPKLKLRLQAHLPAHQMQRTLGTLPERVREATKGMIEISLFPVGSLVPHTEILEAVGEGVVDMALYPEGWKYKDISVSVIGQGIPFVFHNWDEARKYMFKDGYLELLRQGYEKYNVYIIPHEPFAVGLMTKRPIKRVEDLKGIKLRAYGFFAEFLNKVGASTVVIPGGELYTALATGVVDGAHWGDAGPMYELKFHEVCKYYMKPEPIIGSWNNIMINKKVWEKLTPEYKKILEETIIKHGEQEGFPSTRELSKRALEDMTRNWGVQVVELPQTEITKMRKVASDLLTEWEKKDPLTSKAVILLKEYIR